MRETHLRPDGADDLDPRVLDCGRTIDELEDYLDAGEADDLHVDGCPECQQALDSLRRVRRVTRELVQADIDEAPAQSVDTWLQGVVGQLALEVRAGRDIPIRHPDPRAKLVITEGAVRALIRDAGDRVPGIVVGRSTFSGDVTVAGEPVGVVVTASARHGVNIVDTAAQLRRCIVDDLDRHTELNIVSVDVSVDDLYGHDHASEE